MVEELAVNAIYGGCWGTDMFHTSKGYQRTHYRTQSLIL